MPQRWAPQVSRKKKTRKPPARASEISTGLPSPPVHSEVSTGIKQNPHPKRRESPNVVGPKPHQKGRFVPPAVLAPPHPRHPNQEFPGGVRHGEHWTPNPFGDWVRHRIAHPDQADEIRVLGMGGAAELAAARQRIQNQILNMTQTRMRNNMAPPEHHNDSFGIPALGVAEDIVSAPGRGIEKGAKGLEHLVEKVPVAGPLVTL